jgi:hypothetical protein
LSAIERPDLFNGAGLAKESLLGDRIMSRQKVLLLEANDAIPGICRQALYLNYFVNPIHPGPVLLQFRLTRE